LTVNYDYWYEQAVNTSKKIGWLPQVIMSQWIVETAHFTSKNFVINRNIAGQTWYKGCGYEQGTARPLKEGGYYIKYPNAVDGYIDFINRNAKRYASVRTFKTPQEQFNEIKCCGWATDSGYVKTLMDVYRWCLTHNIFKDPPNPHPKWGSLVDYLKAHGWKTDFESRRNYAYNMGVVKDKKQYSGSASQNTTLLNKMIDRYGE
jgi:hypothetical protein